jgi:Domain of unknown function (DUF4375)
MAQRKQAGHADFSRRDGFAGYISDCGHNWKHALAGLNRLGLKAPATILKRGVAIFGGDKALSSNEKRFAASKTLPESAYTKLERLGDTFIEYTGPIIQAVQRAIAANPKQFPVSGK